MSLFGTLGNIGVLHAGRANFVYYLDHNASKVDIIISDERGTIVYRESGMKFAGRHEMIWNGKNNRGEMMPEGAYRITVKARSDEGHAIASKTYTAGKMIMDGKGPGSLTFGGVTLPFGRILSIMEPSNL